MCTLCRGRISKTNTAAGMGLVCLSVIKESNIEYKSEKQYLSPDESCHVKLLSSEVRQKAFGKITLCFTSQPNNLQAVPLHFI